MMEAGTTTSPSSSDPPPATRHHSVVMTQTQQGISLHRENSNVAWIPFKQNSGGIFCLTPETVIETCPPGLPTSAKLKHCQTGVGEEQAAGPAHQTGLGTGHPACGRG